jgi:hypothetical protein
MIRLTLVDGRYLWAKPNHVVAISGYADGQAMNTTVQVGQHQYHVVENAERIVHLMLRWHDGIRDWVEPEGTDATPAPLPSGPSATF